MSRSLSSLLPLTFKRSPRATQSEHSTEPPARGACFSAGDPTPFGRGSHCRTRRVAPTSIG
eukprot:16201737-Heterocapsa_arctica.AAC.1